MFLSEYSVDEMPVDEMSVDKMLNYLNENVFATNWRR